MRIVGIAAVFTLALATLSASAQTPVWIDTDAGCGGGPDRDVDDCWALALALSSPRLAVRGISTVFGNVDATRAYRTALRIVELFGGGDAPPVLPGADGPGGGAGSPAVIGLAAALERQPMTVIALGPLTNVAALLAMRPDLAPRIERLVAVMGRRPGQVFHVGNRPLMHLHDLNLRLDPRAVERVLETPIPVTLMPFEVATGVSVDATDLDRLATAGPGSRRLAEDSRPWLALWQRWLGATGFHPFDSLAVGYVISSGWFRCQSLSVRLTRARRFAPSFRNALEVSWGSADTRKATYCFYVAQGFKRALIDALSLPRPR